MEHGRLTPILLVACGSACTSTITSVRYLAPDLGTVDTVALLPPSLYWLSGNEPRSYVEGALFWGLASTHAALVVWPVETLLARLASADLAETYKELSIGRLWTGVPDSATMVHLCTDLGVRHLLFTEMVNDQDVFSDEPDTPCSVTLKAELWDRKTGRIGWKAVTTAETVPLYLGKGFTLFPCHEGGLDLVDSAVRDFAELFLASPRGKGRDPNRRR